MNKRSNRFIKWGVVVLIVVLGIAAWFIIANGKSDPVLKDPEPTETDDGSGNTTGSAQYLLDFCADEDLNTWFRDIKENTPVELEYVIFGEAPIGLKFTDRELILKTVEALKTVKIGGISNTNPENICDGGGNGYYFTMEDGTERGIVFEVGCFRWDRGKWHDVADYGDLTEVNEELRDIGIKENVPVYADDGGFYTEALETYRTEWKSEDGIGGGLFIYTAEQEKIPYIEICRCETEESSPEVFLKEELDPYMRRLIEESGASLLEVSEIEEFSVGRSSYPAVLYTAGLPGDQGGGKICYLNVILEEKDELLNEPCMVRMCAAYREKDNENSNLPNSEKNRVTGDLKVAISDFHFKYKAYEKKDVQPGNYLVDFINDDRIRTWFAGIDDNFPDSVLYMSESYETIKDPEQIRQLLEALQTVKIGELNESRVGASDRQAFDFKYYESGERQSFEFYGDVFSWNGKDYDVLDWGELKRNSQ